MELNQKERKRSVSSFIAPFTRQGRPGPSSRRDAPAQHTSGLGGPARAVRFPGAARGVWEQHRLAGSWLEPKGGHGDGGAGPEPVGPRRRPVTRCAGAGRVSLRPDGAGAVSSEGDGAAGSGREACL